MNPASGVPNVPNLAATHPDLVIGPVQIYFVWHPRPKQRTPGTLVPSIPKGILVRHHNRAGGECVAWLSWVPSPDSEAVWTLLSLNPLSIAESFVCSRCQMPGGIREGQWWWGLA